MPWVNTIAADRDGNALYADHSVVPNVPERRSPQQCMTPIGLVLVRSWPACPVLDGTRARVDCAWRHRRRRPAPRHLRPDEPARRRSAATGSSTPTTPTGCRTPTQRLEGFARIIGCEKCERTLRTRMVYRYVIDRLADGRPGSRREHAARASSTRTGSCGAELARANGDLDTVCEAADGGEACDRARRPGTAAPNTDSVGTHIFQEFWTRAPADEPVGGAVRRERPAEHAARPQRADHAGHPGDARRAGAPRGEERAVRRAARGSLQVAGDGGATRSRIGGGDARDAATPTSSSSRDAGRRTRRASTPINYGSSHIQAVSFTRRRRRGVDDPDLRAVDRPGVALVRRPDRAVRPGAVGRLPVHGRADRRPGDQLDPPDRRSLTEPAGGRFRA